jgi:hypothetical protein
MRIAFSPDGGVLAVGYDDTPSVDLLDGHSLTQLPRPNTEDLKNGGLQDVAWSSDGQTLFAAGLYQDETGKRPVLAWDHAGRGMRRNLSVCGAADSSITALVPLLTGQLLVATAEPCFTLLEPNGSSRWAIHKPAADFRGQDRSFAVSADGTIIDFGFDEYGKSPLRFDLRTLTLSAGRLADGATRPPKQDWALIGKFPRFDRVGDIPRASAIHPNGREFVLGSSWLLRAFDGEGKARWNRDVPEEVWAVNITHDGRLVVAAYGDGTIHWYRLDEGRELLALQVLSDKMNWVAWTPQGFYAATPGAYGVLRWHVNRGVNAAAETVPVSAIPRLNRPDALPLVLHELETARALGIADLAAARRDVRSATRAAKAPGARLHVLTIGISDYGDKATQLHLQFADKNANDFANALVNTQSSEFNKMGGLYAEILPIYLHDSTADKDGVFDAFASMQRNMAKDNAGQDLAVVMFSGHGAIIDNQFYLLPYGVDATTQARIKASAISADAFRGEVRKVAEHGRVLLLLDTCHSGAASADGSKLAPNADLLRSIMSLSNVTVLTSSRADEFSRENEAWKNGAFTKVLIEALGRDADENHDGLISMSELTAYVSAHLPMLTGDQQHSGVEQRFQSDLFVAGL